MDTKSDTPTKTNLALYRNKIRFHGTVQYYFIQEPLK